MAEKEKLSLFAIGITINDGSATDALYANGKQQCKVFIRVLKETSAEGDSWRVAPLSQKERSSLTVLPYSNELEPEQAAGWYCDVQPSDKYDEGLWRGTGSVGMRGSTSTTSAGANTAAEEFYRYMRFDGKLAPIRPTTFMACITLDDGKQYTTHFDDGNYEHESSITITPQSPYVLHVNDLGLARQDAYKASNDDINVDIYYWTLPGGLRIVDERFSAGYPGVTVEWAYGIVDATSWYRMGVAVKVGITTLTLEAIDYKIPNQYKSQVVPLIDSNCMLRGARYQCKQSVTDERWVQDALMYWIITDNYGCESTFVLKANLADKGQTMELLNG